MTDVLDRALLQRAVIEVHGEFLLLYCHHSREQVDVDPLALARAVAMLQRRQDPDAQVQSGELVGDRRAEEQRRIVTAARQPHRAGERLHQVVLPGARGIRTGAPVAGRGCIDEPRVARAECVVAQAGAVHHAGAEVLHDHVGEIHQLEDSLEVAWILEVDLHTALVAVEGEEGIGLAVRACGEDAPLPHPLAVLLLELDHVGAEVAQDLGCERPLQQCREIEHADAGERPGCVRVRAHAASRPQSVSQRSASASTSARQVSGAPPADQRNRCIAAPAAG